MKNKFKLLINFAGASEVSITVDNTDKVLTDQQLADHFDNFAKTCGIELDQVISKSTIDLIRQQGRYYFYVNSVLIDLYCTN